VTVSWPPIPTGLPSELIASLAASPLRCISNAAIIGVFPQIMVNLATNAILVRRGPNYVHWDDTTFEEQTTAMALLDDAANSAGV
jgi:hypothetical protein